MVTLCWAAKGGSGTTVVAAGMALASDRPTLLVDLAGDLPATLGLPEPDRPGVCDWLRSDASVDRLAELVVDLGHRANVSLLPHRGTNATGGGHDRQCADDEYGQAPTDDARWTDLVRWLTNHERAHRWHVVIDAGTGTPNPALVDGADHRLLVTRACYVSISRAVRSGVRPSGIVLVHEPGRSLPGRDVEHAVGAPIVATVTVDPAVARAVDAGLLLSRLPRVIGRLGRRAAA